ncbi:MAG: hypothetical protein QNK23_10315 [Crocinitomicaceae bacterium]|nr:hypothetical protein [Crocinitomicaceae bacterium]
MGLLLLGLVVEHKEYKTEKPVFITLLDNSASMLNYSDSSTLEDKITSFQSSLQEKYGEKFDFRLFTVGTDVNEDTASFDDPQSNLDKGFDFIYNQFYNRNIGGICFISDGNFNVGKNPIYSAEKISLTPVFSVGVGDTIVKKDQMIRNLAVNEVAFLKNQFPIEVDIEAHKIGKSQHVVSLWRGDTKIGSETIEYTDGTLDFNHVSFVAEASEIGFVRYTVRIDEVDNESSYTNNVRSFYVEVIDSRSKVLILANAPHPDISAIKQVLETDENIEVEAVLVSEWEGSLEEYALLIWHDAGHSNNQAIVDQINAHKTSVLYMIASQSGSAGINNLDIGLKFPPSGRLDEVQANLQESFQLFEISADLNAVIKEWPPLNVRFGAISISGANTLLKQRVGPVVKNDPIIAFKNTPEKKFGVIMGEGLWRWRLHEFNKYGESKRFEELIQKSVQYLTVKKNTEPLRITLPKRFTEHDDILINAEFYNSSFERIIEPDIKLVLTNEQGTEINYEFAKNSKDYSLSLGKLTEGKYTWIATTSFDGKKYSKSGLFVVDNVSIEALATNANHNLLYQISAKTNGEFYTLDETDQLIKALEERKDIANLTYEESSFLDLIDWKILFILLILSLGGEWFIRRYSGSY